MMLCSSAVTRAPVSLGGRHDGGLVERLDGVDLEDAGRDALAGELLGRLQAAARA